MVKLRLNQDQTDWELLPKGMREEGSIYMDGILYDSFDNAKKVMRKRNVDLVIAISGYPGTGKSKIAAQLASFCDPSFTEDRMFQTSEEFQEAVENEIEPLKSYVLDEAFEGLSSGEVRRRAGRLFTSLLNVVRQKRLFIFIVLPDFFDLGKSIAIFRSRWLIHCYGESFGDVGTFIAFDQSSKKLLYIKGKQFENYSAQKADFNGTFTNADSPNFNWKRYEEEIKPKAIKRADENINSERNSLKHRNILLLKLKDYCGIKPKQIAEWIDMNVNYVRDLINKQRKDED